MGNAAIFLVEILGLLCKGMVSIMLLANAYELFAYISVAKFLFFLLYVLRATKSWTDVVGGRTRLERLSA